MFLTIRDPRTIRYYDEDREAMDETNWAVLVGELSFLADEDEDAEGSVYVLPRAGWEHERSGDPLPAWANSHDGWSGDECYACVHVRADDEDALEVLRGLVKAENDYPLLNEDAFSAREWEAWETYWADFGFRDFVRDICDADYADEVEDLPEPMLADLSYRVARSMGYCSGWDGSFDEAGAREGFDAWVSEMRELSGEDA
jgi:hypothetical protein